MSCGKPHEVPRTEVLERVYSCLDGELGQTRYEKLRAPGNDAALTQPAGGCRRWPTA